MITNQKLKKSLEEVKNITSLMRFILSQGKASDRYGGRAGT